MVEPFRSLGFPGKIKCDKPSFPTEDDIIDMAGCFNDQDLSVTLTPSAACDFPEFVDSMDFRLNVRSRVASLLRSSLMHAGKIAATNSDGTPNSSLSASPGVASDAKDPELERARSDKEKDSHRSTFQLSFKDIGHLRTSAVYTELLAAARASDKTKMGATLHTNLQKSPFDVRLLIKGFMSCFAPLVKDDAGRKLFCKEMLEIRQAVGELPRDLFQESVLSTPPPVHTHRVWTMLRTLSPSAWLTDLAKFAPTKMPWSKEVIALTSLEYTDAMTTLLHLLSTLYPRIIPSIISIYFRQRCMEFD